MGGEVVATVEEALEGETGVEIGGVGALAKCRVFVCV